MSAEYRPAHGGKYCIGERRRYRSCNIQVNCSWSWFFQKLHYFCWEIYQNWRKCWKMWSVNRSIYL